MGRIGFEDAVDDARGKALVAVDAIGVADFAVDATDDDALDDVVGAGSMSADDVAALVMTNAAEGAVSTGIRAVSDAPGAAGVF